MEFDLAKIEWADQARCFGGDEATPEFEQWLQQERNKLYKHRTANGDIWLVGSPLWLDWQARNCKRGGAMERIKPRLIAKGKQRKTPTYDRSKPKFS